jgi:hypothetical protein
MVIPSRDIKGLQAIRGIVAMKSKGAIRDSSTMNRPHLQIYLKDCAPYVHDFNIDILD